MGFEPLGSLDYLDAPFFIVIVLGDLNVASIQDGSDEVRPSGMVITVSGGRIYGIGGVRTVDQVLDVSEVLVLVIGVFDRGHPGASGVLKGKGIENGSDQTGGRVAVDAQRLSLFPVGGDTVDAGRAKDQFVARRGANLLQPAFAIGANVLNPQRLAIKDISEIVTADVEFSSIAQRQDIVGN